MPHYLQILDLELPKDSKQIQIVRDSLDESIFYVHTGLDMFKLDFSVVEALK